MGKHALFTDLVQSQTFFFTGTLVPAVGESRLYFEADATLLSVRASTGLAPTGDSALVDINKNGTTIFTTQSRRPTIASGSNTAVVLLDTDLDVVTMAAGDYLTVDIDQVGSTSNGADLTVTVRWI